MREVHKPGWCVKCGNIEHTYIIFEAAEKIKTLCYYCTPLWYKRLRRDEKDRSPYNEHFNFEVK